MSNDGQDDNDLAARRTFLRRSLTIVGALLLLHPYVALVSLTNRLVLSVRTLVGW